MVFFGILLLCQQHVAADIILLLLAQGNGIGQVFLYPVFHRQITAQHGRYISTRLDRFGAHVRRTLQKQDAAQNIIRVLGFLFHLMVDTLIELHQPQIFILPGVQKILVTRRQLATQQLNQAGDYFGIALHKLLLPLKRTNANTDTSIASTAPARTEKQICRHKNKSTALGFLKVLGESQGPSRTAALARSSASICLLDLRRFSSLLRVKNQTRKVASDTTSRIRLATALISGFTPRRTAEKISIGKVVEPGPETKLASTKSSSDRAKAIMKPAASEGTIIGTVIRKNTCQGRAPRSIAASSMERSTSRRRAATITAT